MSNIPRPLFKKSLKAKGKTNPAIKFCSESLTKIKQNMVNAARIAKEFYYASTPVETTKNIEEESNPEGPQAPVPDLRCLIIFKAWGRPTEIKAVGPQEWYGVSKPTNEDYED